MEMYFTNVSDPVAFMGAPLAEAFHERVNPNEDALDHGGVYDVRIFRQFCDACNSVLITAGLPRGDYGQTVHLSRISTVPDVSTYTWGTICPDLIGEQLPLKPAEITGRFGYRRTGGTRDSTIVDEFFFFEYRPGYHPETFSKFRATLNALRYYANIMHKLDCFEVILMENGVHVHLSAWIVDLLKPAFAMNR
jgi:hypothetical protein